MKTPIVPPSLHFAPPTLHNPNMSVISIELTTETLDPERLRKACESSDLGGVVVFCGEVRAVTSDLETDHLEYEAYEEMALAKMRQIAEEASERWHANVAIAHRLGRLEPGDIAVVTIAACGHRAEAFEACRHLIDRIKEDVPIWKKEFGPDGSSWV